MSDQSEVRNENVVMLDSTALFLDRAACDLAIEIPELPIDVSDPGALSESLLQQASEIVRAGRLLVEAKVHIYHLNRCIRATERVIGRMRGELALEEQRTLLKDALTDVDNLKFAALDRMNVLKTLLSALESIRRSVEGGY